VIPPAQFLPLIEPTPLSEEVGNWVFDKGIDQLASWLRMGFKLSLSINVSARHLQSPSFKQRLIDCLAPHPETVAHSLILEVLETAALADIEYTSQLMNECKKMGIRFALDDFGTGYSTLTYLKRLPLDLLKIDRSFVHNMLNDNQDMAIVQGVISLSQTFGCVVVAEGVESIEQAQVLVAAGCEIGQGNGIAKAMPGEEVPLWIKNYRGAVHLSSP
jgi:EAL domain-containing protein (putative c-di-GMP-specific phosphodiesterase class I)